MAHILPRHQWSSCLEGSHSVISAHPEAEGTKWSLSDTFEAFPGTAKTKKEKAKLVQSKVSTARSLRVWSNLQLRCVVVTDKVQDLGFSDFERAVSLSRSSKYLQWGVGNIWLQSEERWGLQWEVCTGRTEFGEASNTSQQIFPILCVIIYTTEVNFTASLVTHSSDCCSTLISINFFSVKPRRWTLVSTHLPMYAPKLRAKSSATTFSPWAVY